MRSLSCFVLAVAVSGACGGAPSVTSRATTAQWDQARAIAVAHVDATYHLPADKVRAANPRLPFLFTAALPGKSAVLVHRGAIVDGGGTDGLGAYLDAVDVYADAALSADDVLDLLYLFRAFPPRDAAEGSPDLYVTDEGTGLSMRIEWRGADADFTLAYKNDRRGDTDDHGSEPEETDTVMEVSLWTLHLVRGATPSWTEARRAWDYEAERFAP